MKTFHSYQLCINNTLSFDTIMVTNLLSFVEKLVFFYESFTKYSNFYNGYFTNLLKTNKLQIHSMIHVLKKFFHILQFTNALHVSNWFPQF